MAAYTDPATGELRDEFHQALAMFLFAWFIVTVIFSIGAMRTSWVLFVDLVCLCVCLLCIACGNMVGNDALLKAGYSMGLVVSFLSCQCSMCLSRCIEDLILITSQTTPGALGFGPAIRHLFASQPLT